VDQPPVLLIHGVGSSFEHNWRATGWVDLLEGEGRTVVGVHLPGHGPEHDRPEADAAELLLEAAKAQGRPVDAVGFSAGGHTLLRAAAREPGAFRRIAVLGVGNPTASDGASTGSEIADGLVADDEPTESTPRIIRRLIESAGNDRFAVAKFLMSERSWITRPDLAQITVPALVVIGDQDFAGPADDLAAGLPDAKLVVLPGVDHFATPSNFGCVDTVVNFLSV
jgi:pimeloyl-ACP methyl ester carboxylesterase